MKLKSTDPEAEKVAAIRVDGKLVKFPLEVDTDEGWCRAYVPLPPARIEEIKNPDPDQDNLLDTGNVEWTEVKLLGKVEIIFRDDS